MKNEINDYYEPAIKTSRTTTRNENYYQLNYANELTKLNVEKQQLISFLEDKIKNYEESIENSKPYLEHEELFNQVQNNIHTDKCIITILQEILDFVNNGDKDE